MLVVSALCTGFLGLSRAEYDAPGVDAHTYAVRGQSGVVFEAERPRAQGHRPIEESCMDP